MRTKYYIPFGIVLILYSCQATEVEPEQEKTPSAPSEAKDEEPLIVEEIDTALVISQLNIKEHASLLNLANEENDQLYEQLDTLELTYYFGFCDCQRWIISDIHNKALSEHEDLDDMDPRGQVQFNLDEHGYYIEAAHEDLELNWRTGVNGTTIRFIGREYKDKRLPEGEEFTVPDPPEGKVFRYYSYEILRPYSIWGPDRLMEIDEETGDSIVNPTILTVK